MKLEYGAVLLFLAAIAHLGCAGQRTEHSTVSDMASAADAFLDSLTDEQRARATFALDADERMRWHFVPRVTFPRAGVPLGELDDAQARVAHALLKTGLSQRGYLTATAIMQLEDVLKELEHDDAGVRDASAYFVTVFGTPSVDPSWAWRFEGHHLSLHFTIVDGETTVSTPSFFGANPARVQDGPQRGRRALAAQEDAARALLESLDGEQRSIAVIRDDAPGEILTGTNLPAVVLTPAGLTGERMNALQQALLRDLLEAHTGVMADAIAAKRWQRIDADGLSRIGFAWAGSSDRGQPHYYRVQGPSFVIEYDNTQNDANHVHVVWRDFEGDFGRDVLREHLAGVPHEGHHDD